MKRSVIILCFLSFYSFADGCLQAFLSDLVIIPQYGTDTFEEKTKSFHIFLEEIKKIKDTPELAVLKPNLDELVIADNHERIDRIIFFEFWNKFQIQQYYTLFAGYGFKDSWKELFWRPFKEGHIYFWKINGISVLVLDHNVSKKLYIYMW